MASAEIITLALARIRADRPGLGLEDSIDAHWIEWFGPPEFRDEELLAGVAYWLEKTPARTWPTVAEIERAMIDASRRSRYHAELEAGPCAFGCLDGLVYREAAEPGETRAVVPCKCEKGQAKRKALEAWDEERRERARAQEQGGRP